MEGRLRKGATYILRGVAVDREREEQTEEVREHPS